ncbi:MAG TPA: SMI1/KNR4 family protein [Herpetosiphonaceae bacterium]
MRRKQARIMLGTNALERIQSAPAEELYRTVTDAALFLAMAGFLDEGNRLLERLWATGLPHPADCALADRGFTVFWDAADAAPDGIPFEREPIEFVEFDQRLRMAMEQWTLPRPAAPLAQLSGLDLLRQSCWLVYPHGLAMPSPKAEALDGLVAYLDQPDPTLPAAHYSTIKAASLAAELAAKLRQPALAAKLARTWADLTARTLWVPDLACNRRLAPILLGGALAPAYGLTPARTRVFLTALIDAVDRRMHAGRGLAYGAEPWRHLLGQISEVALRQDRARYSPAEQAGGWLGRPPCPPGELAAAEARLGLALPENYRQFLLASNGFGELWNGPALLPAAEIGPLRQLLDPEIFEIYQDYGDDVAGPLAASIWVSDLDGDSMVLLIPPGVAGNDWETWQFASWLLGEVRYPSFRSFVERLLLDAEAGDGLE